jgi:hypothetical protein
LLVITRSCWPSSSVIHQPFCIWCLCYISPGLTSSYSTLCPHFLFFFFNRCYNPWWVLACFTISFHNLLSLHFSLQFLTFIFFRSSSTWSNHQSLGLPSGLDEHGYHSVTFLTILVVSIPITCAAHHNLCDFINLTIFFFLIRNFMPIQQYLYGLYIFQHK